MNSYMLHFKGFSVLFVQFHLSSDGNKKWWMCHVVEFTMQFFKVTTKLTVLLFHFWTFSPLYRNENIIQVGHLKKRGGNNILQRATPWGTKPELPILKTIAFVHGVYDYTLH